MESHALESLQRALRFRDVQLADLYEFSSTLHATLDLEQILRVFVSTLMGQMGISRLIFWHPEHHIMRVRGCLLNDDEKKILQNHLDTCRTLEMPISFDALARDHEDLKDMLCHHQLVTLLRIEHGDSMAFLLLGKRFNREVLDAQAADYAVFLARFALIAIDNAVMVERLIETRRMEHEMKIARDLQRSLLPQQMPVFEHFDLAVAYDPIYEVGGDYYDVLENQDGKTPLLVADVEGKGLSAALLAASSQATLNALSQLYFFDAGKFMTKANQLFCQFTRNARFITLFWMVVDDAPRLVNTVNAGHVAPLLVTRDGVRRLDKGGMFTGFMETAEYDMEMVSMNPGDLIVVFTDGVSEAPDAAGEEYGEERLTALSASLWGKKAQDVVDAIREQILTFSGGQRLSDDFTLMVLSCR
jgi:sigma-B regulation protein RsbU (phosphoserine phosphatase)